jgi:phosphoenolpyruvate carboxylase
MSQHYGVELKDTVRYLGRTLGETIRNELGEEWLERIETIRKTGRASYQGETSASEALSALFGELSDGELLTVGRAFAQFLTLGNIAEQEFNGNLDADSALDTLFEHINVQKSDVSSKEVKKALAKLDIDLVLTAHPTEVTRRTLIHKHGQLATCLQELHGPSISDSERKLIEMRIADLISQAWHTEEIRSVRPTPVDEAKWGFAVIENSLWEAVPDFLRELDGKLSEQFDAGLPLDASPVHFSSWMGGDRDGNPNVTSTITENVLLLARCRAAKLFAKDIEGLIVELSMRDCSATLRSQVGDALEPYRALLRPLLAKLEHTRDKLCAENAKNSGFIESNDELIKPLILCYESLHECGMSITANSALLDTIRRVHCFGVHLLRLDIRQDSERHANVFSELTRYLGVGDYGQWTEADKQSFLLRELNSKRPLFPPKWTPSDEVQEVLDTCKTIAKYGKDGFGIYIISMAHESSDVLAVQLLLKEMGVSWPMPVAPLFETLDDLNHSPEVMTNLLNIDWYKGYINGHQYVMIGYSDSAKDAGAIAAGWAQYESQEALVAIAEEANVTLTLFHGRGGTIGRGGLPAHEAIFSQPPGSLDGGFRVTEQGETIRYKFGMPKLAKRSLGIYASAILQAMTSPPPRPKEAWREKIIAMAAAGRDNYRSIVRSHEDFVPYFRVATPEQELGKLPLGSRPAKRKPTGGIESLRAIPWIFAWAQTRMVLPAWLGVMKAIKGVKDEDTDNVIDDMYANWPFFRSRLSMLDMVFHKADARISAAYDAHLVPENLKHFGEALRDELRFSIDAHKAITGQETIMQSDPQGRDSMNIRASYLEPLHYLQIELLKRIRQSEEESGQSELERAMMVTIAGIAIGMRNTG